MNKLKFNVSVVYDRISKDYDAVFKCPSAHIDMFLRYVKKGGRILDAGCGTGVDSAYMASKGFAVTGVDLSDYMLEIAKSKNSNAEFFKKDITKLDFNACSYDAIIASYSLIHIPKAKIKETLLGFYRLLKRGAFLNIGLQEGFSTEICIPEPLATDLRLDVNVMSFEEIKKLLLESGFEILEYYIDPPESKEELDFNKLCIVAKVVK